MSDEYELKVMERFDPLAERSFWFLAVIRGEHAVIQPDCHRGGEYGPFRSRNRALAAGKRIARNDARGRKISGGVETVRFRP